MIELKGTYSDKDFYDSLIELLKNFPDIKSDEIYPTEFTDTRRKGYHIKNTFGARKDPFIGIFINDIPVKGFYSETNECTIDGIKMYLENENL